MAYNSETRVNTNVAGNQTDPSLARLDQGGWVAVWQGLDGAGSGILHQRFDASGTALGSEALVTSVTTGEQWSPFTVGLAGGGFVVTWMSLNQDGDGWGIYQRIYDISGTGNASGDIRVNTTTASEQYLPVSAALSDGGWVTSWMAYGQDADGWGIVQQRFAADGTPVGAETIVNTYGTAEQFYPSLIGLAEGGWVVTWSSIAQDGSGWGVYQQRYDASGAPAGAETRINSTVANDQISSTLAALSDGGWVATWTSYDQDAANTTGVYLQRFASNGAAIGGEVRVNTTILNDQSDPAITGLDDGGWIVSWTASNQDTVNSSGVYQQRYDASGSPVGGETLVNVVTTNHQRNATMTSLSGGDWATAWASYNQDASNSWGIYQRMFSGDMTSPTVTSILRQTPTNSMTNADVVTWRIIFSEDVSNVDVSDFVLSGTTALASLVSINSSTYDISASGGNLASLNGTISLSLSGSHNIADLSGNVVTNVTPTALNHSTFLIQNDLPSATPPILARIISHRDQMEADGRYSFTVTLDKPAGSYLICEWFVAPYGFGSVSGSDFVNGALPRGNVTFKTGEQSKKIDIFIQNDVLQENDEAFTFNVSSLSNSISIINRSVIAHILDDDQPLTNGGQIFLGTSSEDVILGTPQTDFIRGRLGHDRIDGSSGIDTVIYGGSRDGYIVSSFSVTDLASNRDGVDQITNIERLRFSDVTIAFDIGAGQNAGSAYRLYEAVLDRRPDDVGLAGWIKYLDEGGSINSVAQQFLASSEFTIKYNHLDNGAFVAMLYRNVLGRDGEASGVYGWMNGLENGLTRSQVLLGFSESAENQTNTRPAIQDGIVYQEWWLV